MHPIPVIAAALALGLSLGGARAVAAADDGAQFPLARTVLALRDGASPAQRKVVFKGRWRGRATLPDPAFAGAALRIAGDAPTDGDSGLIRLSPTRWKGLGKPAGSKGWRYDDPNRSAGGIERVKLKQGRRGGSVVVMGGSASWPYAIGGPQSGISVTLTLGDVRFCAALDRMAKNRAGRVRARAAAAPDGCPCPRFESTWLAIQGAIFERHGCTQAICHGATAQGGLDLRPENAYANLVDRFSEQGQMDLVEPGEQTRSFLWRKLAKETIGLEPVPGAAMPNGLPPIPESELETLRLWIRAGAPEAGVVANTEALLGSCLPPPDPIKIRPPAVPAATEGIQLHAPPWPIPAQGEDEVCYATWYDYTAQIPDGAKAPCPDFFGGPTQTCFYLNRSELTQDPNSHHSIIHLYKGAYGIHDDVCACRGGDRNNQQCSAPEDCPGGACDRCQSVFGPFTCKGGASDGLACEPTGVGVPAPAGADCGPGSGCTGPIKSTIACVGFTPDWQVSLSGAGTQNAPAIGGSQAPVSQNVFPAQVFSMLPTSGIIVWNSHAFNLTDQPTTNEQFLNVFFAGASDRVFPVQGIFDSRDIFVQNVPPFEQREYCRTITLPRGARLFELSSHMHKRGKLFRVWGPGISRRCGSESGRTKPADCPPGPAGQNIFTTTDYSDPTMLRFDPPMALDATDDDARTFLFCALYDNGATQPDHVKRRSTSPDPPFGTGFLGGPCSDTEVACVTGPKQGQRCNGDDRLCDSAPGAADGVCDACPVKGGVTTEDEMFILLGSYYVVPVP
jgi:hypothetical protein